MQKLITTALLGFLALAYPVSAQSAAELLQKGIYTQETVGDIDAAIRIYQQVIALGSDSRTQAAQAQYRLGLCLVRKGSTNEATKAFEKLITDYPEQKELVAAARQQMPSSLKLLPASWVEGEMLKLKLKTATGIPIGMWTHAIEKTGGGSVVVVSRTHSGVINQYSRMEADLETLRPRATVFRNGVLGESKLAYDNRQVRVNANGKDLKPVELTALSFDNEGVLPLLRRLPLAEGYKQKIDVVNPLAGSNMSITIEVAAAEEIQTPAGKFRTFKVDLNPIQQTFWISNDSHRYIVKMEMNSIVGELDEITRVDGGPTTFRDDERNASISVTPPWMVMKAEMVPAKDFTNALIMDPEAKCHCVLWAGKITRDIRTDMEEKLKQRPNGLKGYTPRPDSWQTRSVNGAEAISVLADYEQNKAAMVEYVTILKQDTNGMVLFARFPAADLNTMKAQFDKVIETARLQ